jgi:hypothetical protein
VFTLVLAALALGVPACGGTKAQTQTSAAEVKAAQTHWRSGLVRWRHSMLQALDGISLIFASEASLVGLESRHSKASARLAGYESTLAGCSATLDGLGHVPPAFLLSGHYANAACKDLENGERLVEEAVVRLNNNTLADPLNPLTQATVPLGSGQSELGTAISALETAST